jgi:hypothetical protein
VPLAKHAEINGLKLDVWALCGAGSFSITNGVHEGIFSSETYPGHAPFRGMSTGSGGGEYRYAGGVETWRNDKPFLILETIGKMDELDTQVYAREKPSENARLFYPAWSTPSGGQSQFQGREVHVVPLDVREGAEVLVDIVVCKPIRFDFLVRPLDAPKAGKLQP